MKAKGNSLQSKNEENVATLNTPNLPITVLLKLQLRAKK
jgi:hypothetical protein